MIAVDSRIVKFIEAHHVMSIATVADNQPYCANLFYSYMVQENLFVFTSARDTLHARQMMDNSCVGATIVLETRSVGRVQGVQITGRVFAPDEQLSRQARHSYTCRFPYAVVADLTLWCMEPAMMKLTDNRLGFGTKLIWQQNDK